MQQALLLLIEKWKKNLDHKGYGGAVIMDLYKAFDTVTLQTDGTEQKLTQHLVHGKN